MGINEVNEDPHKDVEPLKAEVLGLFVKAALFGGVVCVCGRLPQTDRGPLLELTSTSSKNNSRWAAEIEIGKESEESQRKMKRNAE